MSLLYRDTVEFVSVDVDKGLDRLTGEWVHADAEAPASYTILAKCKNCQHYEETGEDIGICLKSTSEPKFLAYGDMIAVTCEMHEKKS